MSHFAVLVIGDDPESQLAPYHEFESTGRDDEYVRDIDITKEILHKSNPEDSLEETLSIWGLENRIVEDESKVDIHDDHKYGYAVIKDGKLVKGINRTNPNSKWDWYVLGGRWSGFLLLKNGNRANQAQKCNIDLQKIDVTYAIVKNGKWLAKGTMGWFGYSSEVMTQEQWNAKYWDILNSLADDTLLSVYDCHI